MATDQEIGQAILDAITAGGLLRVSEPCDGPEVPHIFVWAGNAQEQIGAAARRSIGSELTRFLTPEEFAEMHSLDIKDVRRWVSGFRIPCVRIGKDRLIPEDALERLLGESR